MPNLTVRIAPFGSRSLKSSSAPLLVPSIGEFTKFSQTKFQIHVPPSRGGGGGFLPCSRHKERERKRNDWNISNFSPRIITVEKRIMKLYFAISGNNRDKSNQKISPVLLCQVFKTLKEIFNPIIYIHSTQVYVS